MNPNIDHLILSAHIMGKKSTNSIATIAQWVIFLVTNIFFVCKYVPRAGINPLLVSLVYITGVLACAYIYQHKIAKCISEQLARIISILLTIGILGSIACTIFLIDPYSLRVDRWSATTFFLDGLVQGIYPYGIHTHAAETNFPSPFPLWHYLNIPFWLIGDVGWIQAFFLLVFLGAIYYYFRSWRALLSALLIIYISPAYWWEIVTRSDGFSNALLVCSCILFMERYPIKMKDKWWLIAIISGCIASTRLSAIIPIALYLFRPWMDASFEKKVGFVGIVVSIAFMFFAPYIFWDTETWIFFQRNPFMSQTSPGNTWLLVVMVIIAILIAYKKQTFYYFVSTTSAFIFCFMLVSQLGVIWSSPEPVTLFSICCDISYFTLALPYVIISLQLTSRTTVNPLSIS